MSNEGNLKMMRMRVEALTRQDVDDLVMSIVAALYPEGNMEAEWSADTLDDIVDEIAQALYSNGIPPRVLTGWAK